MSETIKARPNAVRARRDEEAQYRMLMAVSFAVFLVGAFIARLAPSRWRQALRGEQRSILEEARAAAQTSVPFAFMN
ncbi:hypothetical protein [Halorhodospira neutriphila]|uniref:hypothetical protein n=1 Tax=Halorhodospira neutriphila TaxID=168379 RepID=UPI0019064F3C|nr:hypothetical protein [Halorhodospira neutriphila]